MRSRYKFKNEKESIRIPEEYVENFSQSVINIFRLDCFKKNIGEKHKKIRKPTLKNPDSNTSKRKIERVARINKRKKETKKIKEEKKKRREYLYNLAKGNKKRK